MISWKSSFKRLNEEYETSKKKKQALDNLLDTGKISQTTYDLFSKEIAEAIADIENQRKDLVQKMNSKMTELGEQIKTLEILLTNFEIQHIIGEVEDQVYQREINVLSMGLDTSRQELFAMTEASNQLSSSNPFADNENAETKLQEPIIEFIKNKEANAEAQQETPEELETPQSAESATEGEEKQEA